MVTREKLADHLSTLGGWTETAPNYFTRGQVICNLMKAEIFVSIIGINVFAFGDYEQIELDTDRNIISAYGITEDGEYQCFWEVELT